MWGWMGGLASSMQQGSMFRAAELVEHWWLVFHQQQCACSWGSFSKPCALGPHTDYWPHAPFPCFACCRRMNSLMTMKGTWMITTTAAATTHTTSTGLVLQVVLLHRHAALPTAAWLPLAWPRHATLLPVCALFGRRRAPAARPLPSLQAAAPISCTPFQP